MTENVRPVKEFKVALVGGGVCGLTCAVTLARMGVSVQIFEAAAQFEEIGAGLGIGPNAVRVLKSIGVFDEVLAKTQESGQMMSTLRYLSGMEGHELLYEYADSPEHHSLGAHRASFLDALVHFVDPKTTHFNKRCKSVEPSPENPSRSVIHFVDGTTYEADVVIGADGIKSAVRNAVTGDEHNSVAFSNAVCYRGLIPMEEVKAAGITTNFTAGRPTMFGAAGKHVIAFPVKNAKLINVVAFAADHTVPIGSVELPAGQRWVEYVSQDELLQVYEGWGSDVIRVLKCIAKPSKWYIHVVYPPLDSYVKGRIALIGDAAHGMLPHLGAGAGQGIEDAYVLARLLGHPQTTFSNLEAVLQAYDRIRRPRAQMVWEGSVKVGRIYDGYGEHGLSSEGLAKDLDGIWDPIHYHDVDNDIPVVEGWLRDAGVFN